MTPLERATARLLACLDDNRLVELRANAPAVASTLHAMRVGPRRDAWLRELIGHAASDYTRDELDRAAGTFDREQAAAFGMVLALALS